MLFLLWNIKYISRVHNVCILQINQQSILLIPIKQIFFKINNKNKKFDETFSVDENSAELY